MKVLVTGTTGQVGAALVHTAPSDVTVAEAPSSRLDLTDAGAVERTVTVSGADVVINPAAYTAVDRAEEERDTAFAVNAGGAENLATACRESGARLIHVSTDFVFDGEASRPYAPGDRPNPLSVYGESKLAGEQAVRDALGDRAVILRTAWVHAAGGRNFVQTMLRLMGEKDHLAVVADQVGSPSWASDIARALWEVARNPALCGIYHWTDAGVASWYDFAVAIQEEAMALGLLEREIPVRPITTSEFPTPAHRPRWSVLDTRDTREALAMDAVHWRRNLRRMLQELKDG